jgi:dolichol-phosphate mannosyltransferase
LAEPREMLPAMSQTRHLLIARRPPRLLSIVIPLYNEEHSLPLLRPRLTAALDALPCDAAEVLFVNDGSADGTLDLLREWASEDSRVDVICLARNFGQQAAITAGLDEARGDAVVVMDGDLQDPPEVIAKMLERYCEGYDVVYGRRAGRAGESWLKRLTAWGFYRLMRKLVYKDLPADTGDFRLISRPCLDALRTMRETHRFMRGMVAWVGFPQTAVEFERPPRSAGQTNYSMRKMLAFAWTAAVSFSPAPLRISLMLGVLLAFFGLGDGVYSVVRKLTGHAVPGWTSLMVMLCVIGGGVLLSIGILGEYVGRVFEEVKGRPLYVISQRLSATTTMAKPTITLHTVKLSVNHDPNREDAGALAQRRREAQ